MQRNAILPLHYLSDRSTDIMSAATELQQQRQAEGLFVGHFFS